MSDKNLKEGIEYIIDFNSKKVNAVYIGQKKGILFFIEPSKISKKLNKKQIIETPDYLIDEIDKDVTITKTTKRKRSVKTQTLVPIQ